MARPFRAQWSLKTRFSVGAEERIFEASENAGTPAPIIGYKPNDLWLEFPFSPEYLKAIATTAQGEAQPDEETLGKIIALMAFNNQITIPELAAAIGITDRSVERTIRKLQQGTRLRRIGPAKGGYWEVTQ
jgi:ATP-dependent DNA helicase RecG